jgi:type II secretory pathway component PulF
MPVFEYAAVANNNEGHIETGHVIAQDKLDAFDKLKQHDLRLLRLKKLDGFSAMFMKYTANIK